MAAELRWILLGLSLVLLAGIWWWESRRSTQSPGDAQLREVTAPVEPLPPAAEPAGDVAPGETIDVQPRDWGVPPLEPLSIRTQEYDHVPVLDGPMMVDADPRPAAVASPPPSPVMAGRVPTLRPESTERSGPAAAQTPNVSEQQKIVTVRVCAPGEVRWPGTTLLSALELHGLAYGRYQVFHRRHVDGRSLFCVASLIEPGTFDVARMASEEFRGITLFAVLPGPVEPLLTVDELLSAARGLAQELSGMVQDGKGLPLSPQRAAALRDDVARFQAALPRA
ncbi:MAG TPA: cell division protein ZipA C-terminal FtsZ-binding domain-containing protein [Steroidobacteraceae bacterium]|jgi:cell division protein ZipA|nr:cell division protein ZipA C-terminal FtsZ-binding domain-containing protein [Steroidobacteraceae bacterium]